MYKISMAKNLFKESFKRCKLHIGQTDDREIYVTGEDWIMWFDEDSMEKEIKGELISLCGDLPAPGTAYHALPGCGHQAEILMDDILPDMGGKPKGYKTTSFYYAKSRKTGIVLWSEETDRLVIIDNRALGLIVEDAKEVITGPQNTGGFICWKGEGRVFCIAEWPRGDEDVEVERFLGALERGWR